MAKKLFEGLRSGNPIAQRNGFIIVAVLGIIAVTVLQLTGCIDLSILSKP